MSMNQQAYITSDECLENWSTFTLA